MTHATPQHTIARPRNSHIPGLLQSLFRGLRFAFEEGRPPVLGIFMVRFATAFLMSAMPFGSRAGAQPESPPQVLQIAVTAVGWFLLVWACYLANGVADVEEDRANHSSRPIASGRLPVGEALAIVAVLVVAGLALVIAGGTLAAWLAVPLLLLGGLYSFGPFAAKRFGDAALVVAAASTAVTYLAGAATAGELTSSVLVAAVCLSAWIVAGGGMKDLSDIAGDQAAGRRTLPIRLGYDRARAAIGRRMLVVGGVGLILALTVDHLAGLAVLAPAAVLASLALRRVPEDATRAARRRPYRVFMLSQYAANVILALETLAG